VRYATAPIGMVFRVANGATPKSGEENLWDGDIPWVTPADLGKTESAEITSGARSITRKGLDSCGTQIVPAGSIVLSIRAPIGHTAIAAEPMCFNQGCRGLVPSNKLITKFGYWAILSAKPALQSEGQGTTFQELGRDKLRAVKIPLPDLATQRRIADFLDRETARIDLLIEKKQRLVALLGEKYEATAAQLSTGERSQEDKFDSGIDWLGSIPESWSVEKLSWHFYAAKGKDAQKYTKEYCGENEGEFPVYSGQTANEGVMGRIGTYDYDFGETGVLFATTVGAKAMDLRHLQGKFSLSQNCMIIIPRQQIPLKFYLYQMRVLFRKERQLIPDHMQASFRVEDLYRYRIAVPPLDHASDVGAKIEKAEAALKAVVEPVNASIDRLKEYRSALITAAVTGQIEVSTYAKSGTPDRHLDAIQEEMGA
jgi:type I restriction enzyme, S subunit